MFGGVNAPPRNIKRIVEDEYNSNASEAGAKLGGMLTRMTVLKDSQTELQIRKRPQTGMTYDKTVVLNKWITDELGKHEKG